MWVSVVSLLIFGSDAQLHNEAQSDKLVYARGNHWAVGEHCICLYLLEQGVRLQRLFMRVHLALITPSSESINFKLEHKLMEKRCLERVRLFKEMFSDDFLCKESCFVFMRE